MSLGEHAVLHQVSLVLLTGLSRSGTAPEEGALSAADEDTLVQYIQANPDSYDEIWSEIQSLPGLSQAEYNKFAALNPNKTSTSATKRSLADLD